MFTVKAVADATKTAVGTLVVAADNTAPVVTFSIPSTGNTTQSSTSINVTWTESDTGSGVNAATRSAQRQKATPVSNTCPASGWGNDGSATSAASPRLDSGLLNNTCYRWQVTLADNAGNSATTTSGAVLIDTSAPVISFTAPTGATAQGSTSVNVTWTESDTGSGVNAATRSIQRQKATPVSNACSAVSWSNDGSATTTASPRNDTGLTTNTCYRWLANISDNAGNAATQATSGTVLVDNTAPVVTFSIPSTGNTTQSSTSINVTWTESDTGSGVNAATRSAQRQKATPVSNTCPASGWGNDGSATSAASPRLDSGLLNNTCYRWQVTLADNAGNSATTTSGAVLIDTSAPVISFTAPTGATAQGSTSVNVTWTESDTGSGVNAATRSIQRQKATPVSNACSAVSWSNDGSATTTASPRNDTGLTTNTCYRWLANISDNAGNAATQATSGTVLVDNTAPVVTFSIPSTGNTTQSSTSINVTWTESDTGSGVNAATRSAQRQKATPVSNTCPASGWGNDGSATSAASPRLDSGLLNNTCYRWQVTLADNAGNSATTTSGAVLIDTSAPVISFTAPTGATAQGSTSVNVTWTESDTGSGVNAATRSIQRQKATPASNACSAVSWSNDGSATTTASPRNDTGLTTNTCYRWLANISDNAGNAATQATSGTVLVDNTAPVVTNVTSSTSDGAYRAGQTVSIQVTFDEPVFVAGGNDKTTFELNSGATVQYSGSGSGTTTLTFLYVIAAGQNSADLDYTSVGALTVHGNGKLTDAVGNEVVYASALPAPAGAGSLGFNKSIVVDTTAPGVSLTSAAPNPTNGTISVTATFSEPVYGFAVGDITVTNGTAGSFTGIDGDTVFTYIVTPNADGLVTTTVPAASAADLATNPNSVSNTISRTYDTTAPGVA